MKLTKTKLKRIIKEELNRVLSEAYDMPDPDDRDREPSPKHSTIDTSNIGQAPILSDMHDAALRLADMYHHEGVEVEVVSLNGEDHLKVTYANEDVKYFESEEEAEQDISRRFPG